MRKPICILIAAITLSMTTAVIAADNSNEKKPSSKPTVELTPQARQQMAIMHEKMATCLRTSKPMSECRAEMMQQCKGRMGESGCSMMGSMGDGMMHPGMMNQGAGTAKGTDKK